MASGLVDETAYAKKDFKDIYGRDPTAVELNQIVPAYVGADQNIPNIAQGKAFISQMFQTQQNTPDKLYSDQQAKYLADAPKHADQINQLFQSSLGRMASKDELDHFGSLLASGTTDPYQLQQFIQQQPEYTSTQDQKMRDQLSGQLSGYDKQYFSDQILPSIQEAYAKQGRSFDSSAFANSATQSAQAQNTSRQNFLANLTAQQYSGRQQNAYNDYVNAVNQNLNLTNTGIQAQYTGMRNTQDRLNQITDFNTQSSAYNNYLARYGKRNNGLGGVIGMGVGAALGSFGGLKGAQLGGQLGGTFGQGIQNSGGSY